MDGAKTIPLTELLEHAGWARRLARGLVRDDSAADDLVQEAWVAAMRRPPNEGVSPRGWLARVLQNAARMRHRGEARRRTRERSEVHREETAPAAEVAATLEGHRLLAEELCGLAEPYRTTVTLRYLEDLDSEEIGRRQGIPAGTVRWRLHRGLELLRERLDGRSGGDRKTWIAAVAPLAREVPAVGGSVATALLGGLAMWKMIGTAALVGAAALVWRSEQVGGAAEKAAAHSEPAAVAAPTVVEQRRAEPAEAAEDTAPRETKSPVGTKGRVHLRVADDRDRPISSFRVLVSGDRIGEFAISEPTFDVDLSGFESGLFHLSVEAEGHRAARIAVTVHEGRTSDAGVVLLPRPTVVVGRVVDEAGIPVADANVADLPVDFAIEGTHQLLGDTRTAADGTFRIENAVPGWKRIAAWTTWSELAESPPLRLDVGATHRDVVLTVRGTTPPPPIRGVVVDSDGAPVPGAAVRVEAAIDVRRQYGRTTSGADGRFEVRPELRGPVWICARTPSKAAYGNAPGVRVAPGDEGVVLRLARHARMRMRVTDPDGDPLRSFSVRTFPIGEDVFTRAGSWSTPVIKDGVARFEVPEAPFEVLVSSPGRSATTVGPFDPDDLPHPAEVVLVTAPTVQGDVVGVAAGMHVELSLWRVLPDGGATWADGFLSRLEKMPDLDTAPDGSGGFLFTAPAPGRYVVRAWTAEGSVDAPIEVGPRGTHGVVLRPTAGGAIEGVVIAPPGRDVAGVIVGASRGAAQVRTTRADVAGRFRLTGLPPGRYEVREAVRETAHGRFYTAPVRLPIPSPDPWTVLVAEGTTTRAEVTLGETGGVRLAGRLSIDGAPPRAWSVRVIRDDGRVYARGVSVEPDGAYACELRVPGRFRVLLSPPREEGASFVARDLDVGVGGSRFDIALETGELTVGGATGAELWWCTTLADGWALTRLPLGDAPRRAVPAGPGRLIAGPVDPERADVTGLPSIGTGTVPAGGGTLVEVD